LGDEPARVRERYAYQLRVGDLQAARKDFPAALQRYEDANKAVPGGREAPRRILGILAELDAGSTDL
jgi:hypothetical protein